MPAPNDPAATEIRALIEGWVRAVRARDIDGVVVRHTDDVVMFDVPAPVSVRGLQAYRATWPQFFDWQRQSDGTFEIASMEVTAGEDVAFVTALLRCAAKADLARDDTPKLRLTVGLRKEPDGWKIAHEHHSFPDESIP
jgi:uncharacterized protein (TIGR02246 family)